MSLTLCQKEIIELTGYRRISKQMHALTSIGIPFHLTPNRKLIVLRKELDSLGQLNPPEEPDLGKL
jgi:hypothetical protein